jgi:hypothetical protein
MQSVQVNRLELDELWSYVGKKQKRITPTGPADIGNQYVFIGIDATRTAIISYRVGKRDGDNANAFLADLQRRIVIRPEIIVGWLLALPRSRRAVVRRGLRVWSCNQAVPGRARYRHGTALFA